MKLGIMLAVVVAVLPAAALAQDDSSPEAMAAVKPGEAVRFDRDSIRSFGENRSFEVAIGWADGGAPKPVGHLSRRVRYVANCSAGTLAVASVAVYDAGGMLLKSMISPPGAVDATAPEATSAQARWLQDVCTSR